MFIPTAFNEERTERLHGLIASHPLGLLISYGPSGLQVSPVPFVLHRAEGTSGVLRAHLARANPHWRELTSDAECIAIFQGENGYISPSWYPSKSTTQRVVPTWNYLAVEVRGFPRIVEDAAWLREQLEDLTRQHEGRRPTPWAVADAPADYIAGQMRSIVGLELTIARIEGKWKLSQNRSVADREGVIEGLLSADDPHRHPALGGRVEDA